MGIHDHDVDKLVEENLSNLRNLYLGILLIYHRGKPHELCRYFENLCEMLRFLDAKKNNIDVLSEEIEKLSELEGGTVGS